MTGVYLFKTTRTTGLLGISFVSVTSHRMYIHILGRHGVKISCSLLRLLVWKFGKINGNHCRTQMVLAQNRAILFKDHWCRDLYVHTLVKGLHSRTSLWKSGNFGKCFNVTQSYNLISPLLQKKLLNIPTWVCVSFPRNDVGKNPTILQFSNTETHPPQGKKQPASPPGQSCSLLILEIQ